MINSETNEQTEVLVENEMQTEIQVDDDEMQVEEAGPHSFSDFGTISNQNAVANQEIVYGVPTFFGTISNQNAVVNQEIVYGVPTLSRQSSQSFDSTAVEPSPHSGNSEYNIWKIRDAFDSETTRDDDLMIHTLFPEVRNIPDSISQEDLSVQFMKLSILKKLCICCIVVET
jgi:hypothetical protein